MITLATDHIQDLLEDTYYFFLTTVCAFSCLVGKVTVHPEKISTNTIKYLQLYLPNFTSVKAISQWVSNLGPLCQEPLPLF